MTRPRDTGGIAGRVRARCGWAGPRAGAGPSRPPACRRRATATNRSARWAGPSAPGRRRHPGPRARARRRSGRVRGHHVDGGVAGCGRRRCVGDQGVGEAVGVPAVVALPPVVTPVPAVGRRVGVGAMRHVGGGAGRGVGRDLGLELGERGVFGAARCRGAVAGPPAPSPPFPPAPSPPFPPGSASPRRRVCRVRRGRMRRRRRGPAPGCRPRRPVRRRWAAGGRPRTTRRADCSARSSSAGSRVGGSTVDDGGGARERAWRRARRRTSVAIRPALPARRTPRRPRHSTRSARRPSAPTLIASRQAKSTTVSGRSAGIGRRQSGAQHDVALGVADGAAGIVGEAPAHHLGPLAGVGGRRDGDREPEAVEQLRAQLALLGVHRADQHEAGRVARARCRRARPRLTPIAAASSRTSTRWSGSRLTSSTYSTPPWAARQQPRLEATLAVGAAPPRGRACRARGPRWRRAAARRTARRRQRARRAPRASVDLADALLAPEQHAADAGVDRRSAAAPASASLLADDGGNGKRDCELTASAASVRAPPRAFRRQHGLRQRLPRCARRRRPHAARGRLQQPLGDRAQRPRVARSKNCRIAGSTDVGLGDPLVHPVVDHVGGGVVAEEVVDGRRQLEARPCSRGGACRRSTSG